MRPSQYTKKVQEKPSLGSEDGKQKASEDVIEQRGHVLASESSRTWRFQSHGSGFRVKDRRNGLWKLSQCLRNAIGARHVSECP